MCKGTAIAGENNMLVPPPGPIGKKAVPKGIKLKKVIPTLKSWDNLFLKNP